MRRVLNWRVPAAVGTVVATVEYLAGEGLGRALADAWMITVVGAVAIASSRPRPLSRSLRVLLWTVAPAAVVTMYVSASTDPSDWDWNYLSGIVALLVGVTLAEDMTAHFNDTLRHLVDSGTLQMLRRDLGRFRVAMRWRFVRSQNVTAGAIGIVILVGWLIAARGQLDEYLIHNPAVIVFESLAGVLAGQRLGRLVGYGSAWRLLHARATGIVMAPGHPDGAAGLRPIGRFYFRQSLVAGIPAVYLAAWWIAIPLVDPDKNTWRPVYLGQLALAITFQLLVFLLPMLGIHRLMLAWRRRCATEADQLATVIGDLRLALVSATDGHDGLNSRLSAASDWYLTLQSVPAWPVDQALKRWVSLNNAALLVPYLSYVFGNPAFWSQLAGVVGGLKH